ncbi:MAG: TetR/AcrR family transcriptional regulator [Dehalococcoidia bacterium]
MSESVKRRAYDSSRRQAAALQRRLAMLDAARRLFSEKGYAGTTMSDIAEAASVAVDTLYASVGTKAELFSLLLETALSGTAEAIPVERRNYVAVIRAEPDPRRKLDIYASVVTQIWGRMAPLLHVLQTGAANDPALAQIWDDFLNRRADNLYLLVDELEPHGHLRPGLSADEAADTAWAVSSTEVYVLLTRVRGWPAERYQEWLAESFKRLLLADAAPPGT